MKIQQIYTGCLAQGAYYIESEGEVAIIDPLREVQPYIDKVENAHAKIKYVFETHFHADFVSGHLDLARQTGAKIVYGPLAEPTYDVHSARDGEIFELGKLKIKAIHTPGHTMESTTFLLIDEEGKEHAVFTGDTLFIGDVGRPDLAQKAASMTQEELAGILYDSLRNKIMTLPDDVIVYPAHGAGSACGKNMSKETVSTIGEQKRLNYALRADMTREEFIKEVTDGLLPPPSYFPMNVQMNKEGYESISNVLERGARALSPNDFEIVANETDALILDTRHPDDFEKNFIPNSINIGLDGSFAPWVGALIPVNQTLLLVTPEGREEETVTRLARVGYDKSIGYLKGGLPAWIQAGFEIDRINSISASQLAEAYIQGDANIIDVRKTGEFQSEHVLDAKNIPLDFLNDHLAEIDRERPTHIHCAGGYRSMIAISILQARGWRNLINVKGGFKDISQTAIPKTNYVCPSTLK
jgi:hydroxyacylglutathione hydrolase